MMDKNLEFILTVGNLVIKYGLPAALALIKTWKVEGEPTEADIEQLKNMVPPPGTYFDQ